MEDSAAPPSAAKAAEGPGMPVVLTKGPVTLVAVFEAEEGPLLAFALGMVQRRPVAEELVQEAFLRLHQVWGQVEQPRAWLYRCVRNLSLNHLRDHRHEVAGDAPDVADADHPPDEALGRMEAIGVVRMLVAEMPVEDRDLIRLKYHEGCKYAEIGTRTGLSAGNVGYRLHHLLKGLADALRHAGIEGSQG